MDEQTTPAFPARDYFDSPTDPNGYRYTEVQYDAGDHEFHPCYWVNCWSATYNNHRSNMHSFRFDTAAEAEAFRATVPNRQR